MNLQEQVKIIQSNDAYTPEQKVQMMASLYNAVPAPVAPQPTGGYERQSVPVQEQPKPVEQPTQPTEGDVQLMQAYEKAVGKDADADDAWKDDEYNLPFAPTFTAVQAKKQVFNIGRGKKVTIRKLKSGDFMMLAALVPRWKKYLLGDEPWNPFVMSEDKEIAPIKLIFMLIERALTDWNFKDNCPTNFSLSVFNTILFFTKEGIDEKTRDDYEVNDFLDADPDELYDLVYFMYAANTSFFLKIYSKFGAIRNLISTLTGMYSKVMNGLNAAAEKLSDESEINVEAEAKKEIKARSKKSSTGGVISGTGTNSSSPSVKRTKAS